MHVRILPGSISETKGKEGGSISKMKGHISMKVPILSLEASLGLVLSSLCYFAFSCEFVISSMVLSCFSYD